MLRHTMKTNNYPRCANKPSQSRHKNICSTQPRRKSDAVTHLCLQRGFFIHCAQGCYRDCWITPIGTDCLVPAGCMLSNSPAHETAYDGFLLRRTDYILRKGNQRAQPWVDQGFDQGTNPPLCCMLTEVTPASPAGWSICAAVYLFSLTALLFEQIRSQTSTHSDHLYSRVS